MTKQLPYDDVEEGQFVDVEGESEDISELQNDIDAQMSRIFEEFGGDPNDTAFKIHVKRVMPGRGELEHCFSCLPHELPITDRIKNDWGPGEYSIWIYKNSKIWKRSKMNIAKQLDKPVSDPLSSGGSIKDILAAMQAGQERQWQQMQELFSRQMMPQKSQTESMQETLTLLTMMKQVMGDQKQVDPMAQFQKTLDLAKTLAEDFGGGSEKSSLDRLIDTALPALLDGAKHAPQIPYQQPQMQQRPVPMQVPVPPDARKMNPIQPPLNQAQQKESPDMMIKRIVQSRLPQLVEWARQQKDPGLYAEVVLDQIPPMFLNTYINFVTKEGAISELGLINPEVNNFIPWFDSFRTETLELLKEDESEEFEDETLTNGETVSQTSEHVSGTVIEGDTATSESESANPKKADNRNP